jgi:hypothetical protein
MIFMILIPPTSSDIPRLPQNSVMVLVMLPNVSMGLADQLVVFTGAALWRCRSVRDPSGRGCLVAGRLARMNAPPARRAGPHGNATAWL